MTAPLWPTAAALACCAGALVAVPPQPDCLRELAAWFVRPLALPFAWSGVLEAGAAGDAAEAYARGQQILQLLPGWTDGHVVFAYRFATATGDSTIGDSTTGPADRAAAAHRRLVTALHWLDGARATAGRREPELLQAMAFLPEIAVAQQPALADLLRPDGGPHAIADRWLAEAERIHGSPAVREQRTFLAPLLAAGYLDAGDTARALAVIDAAIVRSGDVRDRALATEWCARLREVRAALAGGPPDLAAVRADRRFRALLPHLR